MGLESYHGIQNYLTIRLRNLHRIIFRGFEDAVAPSVMYCTKSNPPAFSWLTKYSENSEIRRLQKVQC